MELFVAVMFLLHLLEATHDRWTQNEIKSPEHCESDLAEECGDTFLYFAYGSNLLTERIHINNPSAIFKDIARVDGYKLDFNHFSKRWQGAAATIIEAPGDHLWGVLWELDHEHLATLDRQEGVHRNVYKRIHIPVELPSGETVMAVSYQLVDTKDDLRLPSGVYKDVIIQGAREHNMPDQYIDKLQQIQDNGYRGEVAVKLHLEQG